MITNPIVLWILCAGAALLTAASIAPFVIPSLTRAWRKATPLGRFAFVVGLSASLLYGGTKTNDVGTAGGSSTNLLMGAFNRLLRATAIRPAVTPEDIAYGWQPLGPYTNANVSFAMPEDATLASNWWVRGAYEDVASVSNLWAYAPVSNLWAYSWGKIRFALNDTNEIVAVGAPMSAIPFFSRLWSARDTNDAFLVTWENFALGRRPQLLSAQIEFRKNGDYVTRSNEFETVWRRIDPSDLDGDGYLNADDSNPLAWDDGAEWYYGPQDELPEGCNSNAYCDITVEVSGTNSQWVVFSGDGPSNYSDPCFYAKPNVPYDVKILIGKTYRVECDAPIHAVGRSSDEIIVSDVSSNAFTAVWPVTITQVTPRLRAAPTPGLLGAPKPDCAFTLDVDPPWLDGHFIWDAYACCTIVTNGNEWTFSCEDTCHCNGCWLDGFYEYEGYDVFFDDIRCGCPYEPDDETTFGLTAPAAVFKNGATRPLEIFFRHGDADRPEEGQLTFRIFRNGNKIRIWEDAEKTCPANTFSWDLSSFGGCIYYIEGVETSESVGDVGFELVWDRPDESVDFRTASTTCAEVQQTEVTSTIPDGSPNQQPFAGHTTWGFDVTHSPQPDKHFAVLFRDVVNDDFTVRDFSVQMTLVVKPTGASVGTASWFALDPTPESGSIVSTGQRVGELRNPKVGGVYHIGSCFDGSPTNECNIVLPLAGAAVEDILLADLARADEFAAFVRSHLDEKQINTIQFGLYFFWDAGRGDYLGRPDNLDFPTVWSYNQVTTSGRQFGKGAIATLFGLPIRISKLSNLLAAYTCDRLGVYQELQNLSQWIGTRNDDSSRISWNCGTSLAHGSNYVHSVSNMVRQCWGTSDAKAVKLWPNTSTVDNHAASVYYSDVERFFYSPGMLYFIQQISTGNNQ